MSHSVHSLAQLAGLTVRTLHYYDKIDLLKPSTIQKNGYRRYEDAELLRLQQILFFRELDFSLEEIKRILNAPDFQITEALRQQKKLLHLKRSRLDNINAVIEKTLKSMNKQISPKDKDLYNAFKDDDVKAYQDEVKERWGNTEAYKQSMKRVGKMTKQEMEKLKDDGAVFTQQLADSMEKGPEHPDVQALIVKHHQGINFFYTCDDTMYRNLGQMYVDDPRFTAYYNKFRAGLAIFMRDAINIYCDARKKTHDL